jgi:DNA-binding transcriptional LysR family regulator
MTFIDGTSSRIKMNDLRMLLVVVERGSMSKAARHLNISQSAISKALAGLEHTLGVRLLDRNPQGVEPTTYGRALFDRGVAILDELQHATKDIEFLADPAAGELRIGINAPVAGMFTKIIERLSIRCPKMVFHVVERDLAALMEDLRKRGIDLLVGRISTPLDDEIFSADVLFEDNVFVAAGSKSTWARRRKIDLAELLDERWILPTTSTASAHIADTFRANGLSIPRVSIFSSSPRVRDRLLATGRYVAMVPGVELRFSETRAPFKVLPITLRAEPRPVGIVTLKNRTLGPAAQLFIEEARDVAKPLKGR